ncbi:tubulin binding cofactor A family protein [Cryptosporidium andersoni]|uniref:Tubulin-specific chaperone A n=1 Tax=Cryptosporidium andersoni TaxID=117008 RepID=A0A1J4MA60_9CRYT|nr:tubulin binding cofactor A family protein [Cryptosporidium andersoni]
MSDVNILRQLKIMTAVLNRTMKDLEYYKKEEYEFNTKIELMKNQGRDIHDIQQQEKCLHETLQVYHEVLKRLHSSYFDLKTFLTEYFDEKLAEIDMCNLPKPDDELSTLLKNAYMELNSAELKYNILSQCKENISISTENMQGDNDV